MNKISKVILVLIVCAFSVLGFRAYRSYVDYKKVFQNEMVLGNALNLVYDQINGPAGVSSFVATELPQQQADFKLKVDAYNKAKQAASKK